MKKHIRIVCAILAVAFYSEAIELMDELVVQSTRIKTPLDLMSSSVDVITAEELQASGVSYVSDALLLQPGISGSRVAVDPDRPPLSICEGQSHNIPSFSWMGCA